MWCVILIMTILLSMSLCLRGKDCGLLLGLRSSLDGEMVYRTLWITSVDGVVELTGEGQDLLVPRKTGFWRVGMTRLADEQWEADIVWAIPAGAQRPQPVLEYDETCEGGEWMTILFLGNDYVSFDRESDGYCEGAAHPWLVNWLEVFPLDDIHGEEGCIPLSECVGEGANTQLLMAAEQYRAGLSEDEREMLEEQPTDCSWGVIRRRGQWVLRGRLRYSYEVHRGHYADFDIPLKPPASLVSHDALHPSWDLIRNAVPGAVDAFCSPGKDMLVVITGTALTVYHVTGNAIGAPALSLPLSKGDAAVMIQWAEGKHVQRWTEAIEGYLPGNE
jgi:hypothetical protein